MQDVETAVKELINQDHPVVQTLTSNPRLLNDLVSNMKKSGVQVLQMFLDPRTYVDVLQGSIQYRKNEDHESRHAGLMGFLTSASIHMSRHVPFRDAWVVGMRVKAETGLDRFVVEHYKIDRA